MLGVGEKSTTRYGLIGSDDGAPRGRTATRAVSALAMLVIGAMAAIATWSASQSGMDMNQPVYAAAATVQLQREQIPSSQVNDDGKQHKWCESPHDEFEQCAGYRDGQKLSGSDACCRKGTWCAHFGDWWGMCIPDKPYPDSNDHNNHDRQRHEHNDHDHRF